jgi:hypothetical protein
MRYVGFHEQRPAVIMAGMCRTDSAFNVIRRRYYMKYTIAAVALLVLATALTPIVLAAPAPNTWVGSGPFATGLGDRVVSALAVSADGQTVYSGTVSGTLYDYDYGYLLNIGTTGSGSGQVTSDSGGISCSSGSSSNCSATYVHGTIVTLNAATLTARSTFDGWSQDCSGVASCPVAITGTKNVSAGFGLGNGSAGPVARILSTGTGYLSITNAYQAAGASQVIQAVLGAHSAAGILNEAKTVTLKGGYAMDQNYVFVSQSGFSSITGPLKVGAGRLNADKVKIKAP